MAECIFSKNYVLGGNTFDISSSHGTVQIILPKFFVFFNWVRLFKRIYSMETLYLGKDNVIKALHQRDYRIQKAISWLVQLTFIPVFDLYIKGNIS